MPERHPDTDAYLHDCQRCGDALNPDGRPVEYTATYYVEAADERNPYETDVAVALRHTDATRKQRDRVKDDHGMTLEAANNVLARRDAAYADDPPDHAAYDREVGVDPESAKHDPDVVQVVGERVEIDRPAFLLVCADCKREGDRVEWAGAET